MIRTESIWKSIKPLTIKTKFGMYQGLNSKRTSYIILISIAKDKKTVLYCNRIQQLRCQFLCIQIETQN